MKSEVTTGVEAVTSTGGSEGADGCSILRSFAFNCSDHSAQRFLQVAECLIPGACIPVWQLGHPCVGANFSTCIGGSLADARGVLVSIDSTGGESDLVPEQEWKSLTHIENQHFSSSSFLHESRRYVRRFCTSHLVRVKKELLYRLHTNRKKRTPKPPTTKQNQATKPTPQRRQGEEQPVMQLAWPRRHGEER